MPGVAMEEQPITLATHVAVETDTDAGGVAAATRRLRREFPGLDANAIEVPQEGEPPPGTGAGAGRAWRAGRQRRPVAAAYPFGGHGTADPASTRDQPPRSTASAPAALCYLRPPPPKAACDISQKSR